MTRFWSLCRVAAFTAGSGALAANFPDWWANFFVRGLCLTVTISQAVDAVMLLRPVSSDAERPVLENMQAKNPPIVPVQRRR